jgi:hypothetical protein
VTQYVRSKLFELAEEMDKLGKAKFCREYDPAVVNTGIVRRK